jgi:hypothetical protein
MGMAWNVGVISTNKLEPKLLPAFSTAAAPTPENSAVKAF